MVSLAFKIKTRAAVPRRIVVELDAAKFERLAADFGFFNPAFIKSLAAAEADVRAGRVRKVRSFKGLRT